MEPTNIAWTSTPTGVLATIPDRHGRVWVVRIDKAMGVRTTFTVTMPDRDRSLFSRRTCLGAELNGWRGKRRARAANITLSTGENARFYSDSPGFCISIDRLARLPWQCLERRGCVGLPCASSPCALERPVTACPGDTRSLSGVRMYLHSGISRPLPPPRRRQWRPSWWKV